MKTATNIYPTHTCFDDCTEIIKELLKEDRTMFPQLLIVHAVCLLPDTDHAFSHAWVEHKNSAFFMGIVQRQKIIVETGKADIYKSLRVKKVSKYTITEAAKYKEPPPWKAEYQRLCKNYTPIKNRNEQSKN